MELFHGSDDDGRFAIAFKVGVHGGAPAKLKVTSCISTTVADEIESAVDDPEQPKFLWLAQAGLRAFGEGMPIIPVLRFSAVYFLLVFGAGFVLGPIRVILLEPRVGTRAAELAEMPVMLAVIFLAARFCVRRFDTGMPAFGLVATGFLAVLAMLGAELWVGMALRGLSVAAVFTERDPVSGTAYYLSLALFAAMPWFLGRGRPGGR